MSESLTDIFGSNIFGDSEMKTRLPKPVYKSLKKTIETGSALDVSIADAVATAMKDWAIDKGASHYCHWFQPMTGLTAEKHDAFLSPSGGGEALAEFKGQELIQGEPDASSFPNGGLRPTFEARGYTAWDVTSPVFVKGDGDNRALFIPTAFYSYTGEALDKKTPLLRSCDAVEDAAVRILHAMGDTDVERVNATLGCEQEYFLIDEAFVEQRLDLMLAGRTLFGAPSPRGQEKCDHYFGNIPERIASVMAEVNQELWKLGVPATTQHNEVAPSQYELAPVFGVVTVGADQNALIMETLKKVARRHGLYCLLHEKPFAGLNGSGKHMNWSLGTDTGVNLLDPGDTPHDNALFLIFCAAVIKAVDENAEILRASVATTGNDHRLGANEAPPAIISIFLGSQLEDVFKRLAKGPVKSSKQSGVIKMGFSRLPTMPKDNTDRNRTSPFAFTGNKFEFRMAGSTVNPSGPASVLNSIVASVLVDFAKELEKSKNPNTTAQKLVQKVAKENLRVVFNGDGYADAWVKEAEKRGLPHLRNAVEAFGVISSKKVKDVFKKTGVLNASELAIRQDILYDEYAMNIEIEGKTTLKLAKRSILPASIEYTGRLASAVEAVQATGIDPKAQTKLLGKANDLVGELAEAIEVLEAAVEKAEGIENTAKRAASYRDGVVPAMNSVRAASDGLEMVVDRDLWPLPTYAEMLFYK